MPIGKLQSGSFESQNSIEKYEHIVFLGTFNADPFRGNIEKWLPALNLQDTALFVADNRSIDGTNIWMVKLLESLDVFSVFSTNDGNFGGYGNVVTNLHRFKSAKWITTLHQDDQYSPDHLRNHIQVINARKSNLGMICSEAKSVTSDNKSLGYPRAHWLLEETNDALTVFMAHLRNHAFPFSGATFSKDVLLDYPIPWHSTAFPDTEIVMKMITEYNVAFAEGVTVEYLENPLSESHSLSPQHRDFGAFQALLRVFFHPNYGKLCKLISDMDIRNYLSALDTGISLRFNDSYYAELLKHTAFEITAQHLGSRPEIATRLAEGYLRVGDIRALEILETLGARIPNSKIQTGQTYANRAPSTSAHKIGLLVRVSGLLPRRLRKSLFKTFMKTRLGRKALANWNFNWRSR